MVWGELKSYGVSVSRRRVRESLVRVNPTGVELRASTSVIRRAYSVYHVPMPCGTLTDFTALYDGGLLSTVASTDTQGRLSTLVRPTITRARLYFSFFWKPPEPMGGRLALGRIVEGRTLKWQGA